MLSHRSRIMLGFTIVEIMIVLAIIGILAGIVLPNLVKARAEAKLTACISNLEAINAAYVTYSLSHSIEKTTIDALELLVDGGYLKETPKCPSGGKYYVVVTALTDSNYKFWGRCHVKCTGGVHADAGCTAGDFPTYIKSTVILTQEQYNSFMSGKS